ncbi:accessory gene regulator B family protein [Traorella massiliensis]|uniref:accessory gene regulator B family protein n=1 Tax=Traorella massiliensis TaxID=1903263 RepID=UPI0008F80E3F|nr:accessory gene regulator B family protein [Traorella massiliensis]
MKKDRIYEYLLMNGINMEKEVFDYGFMIFLTYMEYILIIIPISLFLDICEYVVIFLLLFIPLRRYIGGYHMSTMKKCFIGSLILALSIPMIAIKIGRIPFILSCFIFIICLTMTNRIGVLDHPNKRVLAIEKKVYGKRAELIEIIYIFLYLILYNTKYNYIGNIITLLFIFFIISFILSKKQNKNKIQ